MAEKSQRTGFYGGSFNPPTLAHKQLSEFAFSALKLDGLHLIVTPHNPEKEKHGLAPFPDRMAMTNLLAQSMASDHIQVSDIEDRLGSSWTVNTVRILRQEYPDDYLFFIMGSDNWHNFHRWGDDFAEILDYVSIVTFNRPGHDDVRNAVATEMFQNLRVANPDQLSRKGTWCVLDAPLLDMSATKIRAHLRSGENITDTLPEILDYIRENGLYR